MKWFAVLFIGVLAEGFVAPKCDSDDPSLLPNIFTAAALTFPSPTILDNDVAADQFKKDYMEAREKLGVTVAQLHYDRASAIGNQLIDKVRKDYAILEESIKLISKDDKKSTPLDDSSKALTKQLNLFLDLKPGNMTLKPSLLPDLPPQPTVIMSETTNLTASDYFVHFPKVINDNYYGFYGYIVGIYLKGWEDVRKYFEEKLTDYRNDILNCKVMKAYRIVVENVFEKRDYIQPHVDSETWDAFKKAGISIITISNNYNKSLKRKAS